MSSLREFVQDLGNAFPGIESRPDVCGGEACVVRTRIPVWLLENARRSGVSEQVLLASYPALRAADLVNAWNYARSHAAEIDRQIGENETAWYSNSLRAWRTKSPPQTEVCPTVLAHPVSEVVVTACLHARLGTANR
jgi:uncharacterized protein (DUF433 family)